MERASLAQGLEGGTLHAAPLQFFCVPSSPFKRTGLFELLVLDRSFSAEFCQNSTLSTLSELHPAAAGLEVLSRQIHHVDLSRVKIPGRVL
jgi:hypothetical protein